MAGLHQAGAMLSGGHGLCPPVSGGARIPPMLSTKCPGEDAPSLEFSGRTRAEGYGCPSWRPWELVRRGRGCLWGWGVLGSQGTRMQKVRTHACSDHMNAHTHCHVNHGTQGWDELWEWGMYQALSVASIQRAVSSLYFT